MRRRNSLAGGREGFTLLEMLVASLLLGMLVTILTMVFNSSSIAWRTGKAGVAQLSSIRRQMSLAQYTADNLMPCIDSKSDTVVGKVCGAGNSDGSIRTRAVSRMSGGSTACFSVPSFGGFDSARSSPSAPSWVEFDCNGSIQLGSSQSYIVGVWSYGPDGQPNTEDDITTWPLEVN